ncbi:flavin reductase family protein [Pseudovibrio sp. Tun.PSC04-5.I4]|uniref:flavin reductase family protein n=1 Tax=Pseudovibrio sp. Tun.PSC04-5.I4 TaxID=1798213 RepID=UPI00088183E0|nr:flavin reductase family protein [Pseudovibrio sp. Tun.PSC04-5.I4]SDR38226.1 NADH-FMN oxidoreductase RutF, flavin reductase (DIM6/NTAB) family [Pseudovibrio sp. Tun.PSC04-5.I4]
MFYEAHKPHGLPHNPFKAIVAPRPIGWISTLSKDGTPNLAPYSFFNAVCDTPPIVAIGSSGYKDSVRNIEATGEFVCNQATLDLADAMNMSSAMVDSNINEFELAGLTAGESNLIKAPRVLEAKTALECKLINIQRLVDIDGNETNSWLILGQVVGVHIDESVLTNGILDVAKMKPLARLGYKDYSVVDSLFQIERPVVAENS